MNIEEAKLEIARMLPCIPWVAQQDSEKNSVCPLGDKYEEQIFWVAHDLFENPEDALCRIMISKICRDMASVMWHRKNNNMLDRRPVLFWRVEPELNQADFHRGKLTALYTRYVVTLAEKDWLNNNVKK